MTDQDTQMTTPESEDVTPSSRVSNDDGNNQSQVETETPRSVAPQIHASDTSDKSHPRTGSVRVRMSPRSGTNHRSARTSASSTHSLKLRPFGFESKTAFDATEDLLKSRSETTLVRESTRDDDIWKRPPPDFRPQVYGPRPPKRNSSDAVKPWKYGTIAGQRTVYKRPERVILPHILNSAGGEEGTRMVTQFHVLDALEDKMEVIRDAIHHHEPFVPLRPHDFRPYPPIRSLGLPEFTTDCEKDPASLKFRSQRLNKIHGLSLNPATDRNIKGQQMAPAVPRQPHFEGRLVLQYEDYPIRPASYTRFRRINRDPKSALMERIDHTLSATWAKEILDKEIAKSLTAQNTLQ